MTQTPTPTLLHLLEPVAEPVEDHPVSSCFARVSPTPTAAVGVNKALDSFSPRPSYLPSPRRTTLWTTSPRPAARPF